MCQSCDGYPGLYDLKCLDCCARLVLSTKPDKDLAKSMLVTICRFPTAPAKKDILNRVKQLQDQKV